jgi:glycosyltransferase involved in cell wall biosynthesis
VIRVLYVAYHFPPTGGAGVQRTLKFVRYLPEFGVLPTVLTGPVAGGARWTPADETLAREIPPDVEVIRAPGPEPTDEGRWRAPATRWLRLRSRWTSWWRDGLLTGGRRVAGADVLLCSMSPFQSAAPVAELATELGIPWVADLRDPWALDEMTTWPSGFHRRLERRAMRRALGSAAAVVMNTPTAAAALQENFPELEATAVVAIPNGFDSDDFGRQQAERTDASFRIVHTGYLHTALGLEHRDRSAFRRSLGGSTAGVDFLTRSHVVLLEALDRLSATDPEAAARVELWLAGVLSDTDLAAVGKRANVHVMGYLSHRESIDLMCSADLLFLPMHDLPHGRRATIVPGKTYEYLATGRPVLAAVPDGDARDLIGRMKGTVMCRPDDVDAMTDAIAHMVRIGRVPSVDRPELEAYERRVLTRKLAEVLHSVERHRGANGAPRRGPPRAIKPDGWVTQLRGHA